MVALSLAAQRHNLVQLLNLCLIVSSAYMGWKAASLLLNTESPVVVVLSGSMEPLVYRGDIMFLRRPDRPYKVGDITVYKLQGKDIPIVHRVIAEHTETSTGKQYLLTKGDNNPADDRGSIYNYRQDWIHQSDVMGLVTGHIPYVGMLTIWMNEYPVLKYSLLAVMGFFTLMSRD